MIKLFGTVPTSIANPDLDLDPQQGKNSYQLINNLSFFAGEISNSEYELTFLATVGALGLETFYLRQLRTEEEPSDQLSVATLRLFHTDSQPFQVQHSLLFSVVGQVPLGSGIFCRIRNILPDQDPQ